MRKYFSDKPWYFAFCVLAFFAKPLLDWLIRFYINDAEAEKWMNSTVCVQVKNLVFWVAFTVITGICIVTYIIKKRKDGRGDTVTPTQLESIGDMLKSSLSNFEYLESLQAYQYNIKNDDSYKYVKINFVHGVADERIEISSILQTYCYFPYSIYKRMKTVSNYYRKYMYETNPDAKYGYRIDFMSYGAELCDTIYNILNSISSPSDIKTCHCELYRVLATVLPALKGESIESFLNNGEVEEALCSWKKTGILGSIILNDLYIFKSDYDDLKKDRIYFTFPLRNIKNMVILATVNSNCLQSAEEQDIKSYCSEVIEKINGPGLN